MRFSDEERLADFGALLEATTPDELHRVLVLGQPATILREPSLAIGRMQAVHRESSDGAESTVVLMATDVRCRSIGPKLLTATEDRGIVSSEMLDILAEAFVAADKFVYWECPAEWFDGPVITLEPLEAHPGTEEPGDEDEDGPGPAVVQRRVPDWARRWAARRLVESQPERWAAVHRRAAQTTRPIAAALLFGLLDAAEAVPEAAANFVEVQALRSGDSGLRWAGLRRRALRDPEGAVALALADGVARIRDKAGGLAAPDQPSDDAAEIDLRDGRGSSHPKPRAAPAEGQSTLF